MVSVNNFNFLFCTANLTHTCCLYIHGELLFKQCNETPDNLYESVEWLYVLCTGYDECGSDSGISGTGSDPEEPRGGRGGASFRPPSSVQTWNRSPIQGSSRGDSPRTLSGIGMKRKSMKNYLVYSCEMLTAN